MPSWTFCWRKARSTGSCAARIRTRRRRSSLWQNGEAQEFINDLLSGLRERMLELKSGKVIFLGGGATLLRRQIEASGKIGQAIFVEDINANAKGYEYLYRLQHSGR